MLRFRPAIDKAIFLAVGMLSAALGAYGTNMVLQAESTRDWPTAPGKIVTAEIRPGDAATNGRAAIRFEYAIRGSIYRSEQYRTGAGQIVPRDAAEAVIQKYPVGTGVVVHYDPANPSNSVVEQGDPTLGYVICATAVLLLGVAAAVTIVRRKRAK
jgi:hypothetical protein